MNQKIKISQLPAKGSNLAAQDLIEIAEFTGTGYVSKSITGQEIIDAAVGNVDWGDIGGTLSAQTDLQSALDAKVPTSRTLTINGTTQDLSANRTFTISTGITIGSTAIASGVVGRVLFEGAGNVVQESSSLFWDATNNRLGIGTSTPSDTLDITGTAKVSGNVLLTNGIIATSAATTRLQSSLNYFSHQRLASSGVFGWDIRNSAGNQTSFWNYDAGTANTNIGTPSGEGSLLFTTNGLTRATINFSTGNVLIGTTTDAGFRLDVNGTARVQSGVALNSSNTTFQVTGASSSLFRIRGFGDVYLEGSTPAIFYGSSGTFVGGGSANFYSGQGTGNAFFSVVHNNNNVAIRALSNSNILLNPTAGNVLIGTTTDAGFRLDVNGTARVITSMLVGVSATQGVVQSGVFRGSFFNSYSNSHTIFEIKSSGNASFYQGAAFGTSSDAVASAQVEIVSTTKGFLPPRMTTTQKNAIASPAAGLMVYDTTLNVISYYNGSMWI